MTAKTAYELLIKKVPCARISKCVEYNTLFVFQLSPTMLDVTKSSRPVLNSTMSVNKKTGDVRSFNPFDISLEEYKQGTEIPATSYRGA